MKAKNQCWVRTWAILCCVLLFLPGTAYAALQDAEELIPVGKAVGIRLTSDGVTVVGLSGVKQGSETVFPARDAGLQEGDVILSVDGTEIHTAQELQNCMKQTQESVCIKVRRGETELELQVTPVFTEDGSRQIGVWIRDQMVGIGTLTFFDPSTGEYGALGHGISDQDTGKLLPVTGGDLLQSSIEGVKRGEAGAPGELQGTFQPEDRIGSVRSNTDAGIFGSMEEFPEGKAIPVADEGEVQLGDASILSCVDGSEVRQYEIRIAALYHHSGDGHRDMLIEVTDPALIAASGGIVQGMSGSPIVQNGKLVGAITHVLVNDPTKGYGILIGNMLQAGSAAS